MSGVDPMSSNRPIEPLRRRTAFSVLWTAVRFGGDQAANFVLFIVLARILIPAEFGAFVIALVFVEFGKIIANGGLTTSLYRTPVLTPQITDTVFWANLTLGCLIAVVGLLFSEAFARAMGAPQASSLIAVLGFVVPITALGASHQARNLREFGHRALAVRSLISGVVGGGLALLAAFHGFGVWSLVVQRFSSEIINTAVAWWSFRWAPGFRFSWSVLGSQFAFGSSVAAAQLLMTTLHRSQNIILTRVLGPASVGIYWTAWKVTETIAQGVIGPFSTVSLPALAKLQHDREAFAAGYVRMVAACALISFPAMIGAGVLADQIIPLVFGPQWGASIPVAKILSLLVLPIALDFFADPALAALGKSRTILMLAVVKLGGDLVFCIAAAPYGLVAFAVAHVARSYLTLILQMWLLYRVTGIAPRRTLVAIAPALMATLAMAACVAGLKVLVPAPHASDFMPAVAWVVLEVLAGALVYAALVTVLLGRVGRAELVGNVRTLIATAEVRDLAEVRG